MKINAGDTITIENKKEKSDLKKKSKVSTDFKEINLNNYPAANLNKAAIHFTSNGSSDDKKYEEELDEILEDPYGMYKDKNIKKGSEIYNRIISLMKENNLCADDAADIVIFTENDEELISKAIKHYNPEDSSIDAYNIARLVKQGVSDKNIKLLLKKAQDETNAYDILYSILDKEGAIDFILRIMTSEEETLDIEEAETIAKKLEYDAKKFDKALDLKEKIGSDFFDIQDAVRHIESGKDYTIEEIKNACEMLDKNFSILSWYSIEDIIENLRNDNEKFMQMINFASENNIMITKDGLEMILENGLETAKKAVEFMKENNVPFDEAMAYTINSKNPQKTKADEIYPKDLSDEELVEKYNSMDNWEDTVYDMYCQIRRCDKYAIDYGKDNYSGNYGELYSVIQKNKGVITSKDYWVQRKAIGVPTFDTIADRISLNVKGDAELIKKLDELMIRTNDVMTYKTPQSPAEWGTREDPITIYFRNKITPELYEEITEITRPYARGKINLTPENSTTPWIKLEEYAQGDMVVKLLERAEKINKDLYEAIKNQSRNGNSLSTGYYQAGLRILDEYERYLAIKN